VLASAPVAQKEEQGGTSSGAAATVMMACLAPSELPPPPPSRAAAETCTAVALQGGYLVCAFALTLGRSKVSFKSRRKKEVKKKEGDDEEHLVLGVPGSFCSFIGSRCSW